jgi:tRNA A37 N6-isopentenylltransferase MiaA
MTRKPKHFTGIVLVGLRRDSGYDEVWEILDDSAELIGSVDEIERGELDENFEEDFTEKILRKIENINPARDEIINKEEKARILRLIDEWFRENIMPDDYSGYSNKINSIEIYKLIKYR